MRIDVISIFPAMFSAIADAGITGRALDRALWALHRWDPRDFTTDRYRRVDDRPYGGGPGMVMMVEPLERATDAAVAAQRDVLGSSGPVILLSPAGSRFDQAYARRLVALPCLTLVCGRYEAIDQRFIDRRVDHSISIGDFVVSGGELPAMLLIDTLVRLLPGAVNDPASVEEESFVSGLLDCPHYTRPEACAGETVPPVLLSGDHKRIARWRRGQALLQTARHRPDMIEALRSSGHLSSDDERVLDTVAGIASAGG